MGRRPMTDEEWPDDYVDPLQRDFEEFISETFARTHNGEASIVVAVAEAADSEFARMYEISPGYIEHHVSCGLGVPKAQAADSET